MQMYNILAPTSTLVHIDCVPCAHALEQAHAGLHMCARLTVAHINHLHTTTQQHQPTWHACVMCPMHLGGVVTAYSPLPVMDGTPVRNSCPTIVSACANSECGNDQLQLSMGVLRAAPALCATFFETHHLQMMLKNNAVYSWPEFLKRKFDTVLRNVATILSSSSSKCERVD